MSTEAINAHNSNQRSTGKRKGPFNNRARMMLIIGAILLVALSMVIYAWTRDSTILATNQVLTFIVGFYFHQQEE